MWGRNKNWKVLMTLSRDFMKTKFHLVRIVKFQDFLKVSFIFYSPSPIQLPIFFEAHCNLDKSEMKVNQILRLKVGIEISITPRKFDDN